MRIFYDISNEQHMTVKILSLFYLKHDIFILEKTMPPQIILQIISFIMIPGIIYFFLIRPQTKRVKEHEMLLTAIKVGDIVYTNGGIIGKIKTLQESFVQLQVAPNTLIYFQKNSISHLMPQGSMKNSLVLE